ncbi:MAG: acyl carrier protein [Bilifractor sp.]
MTREEVLAKMIEFAAMAFGKDAAKIKEDTDIAAELGVKSSQRVAMAASIENDFDVMIPVARFGNFKTIGDLVDYVMDEM